MIGRSVCLCLVLELLVGLSSAQDSSALTTYDLVTEAATLQKRDIGRLKRQSTAGEVHAQMLLAIAYHYGFQIKQDQSMAAKWISRAAQAGEPRAQIILGRLYEGGIGVPRNSAEAALWFRRAADKGNAEGQFELGIAYEHASGVPQDKSQANALYRMAADSGFGPAKCALALNDPKYRRTGGGAKPPHVTHAPDPEYSENARNSKLTGTVYLWAGVGDDGVVHEVCVLRPLGLGLEKNAIEAVRQWIFDPAIQDGRPVPYGLGIEVTFRLY